MIFIELVLFIFIWTFSKKTQMAEFSIFFDPQWPTMKLWMTFLVIKCVISIILSLFKILTVRPAVVK